MLKSFGKVVLGLLLCVAAATQASAQFHPLPGSKSEQPVLCDGCKGVNSFGQPNDGLPTYPYDAPLVDFVGRYVDSSNTIAFQHVGIRTVRAGLIRVAPDTRGSAPGRMYVALGEAVGAYTLNTFFTTKLPGGTQTVNKIPTGGAYSYRAPDPLERVLVPEGYIYPEANGTKWRAPFQDGQTRLFDFDFDDRGNVYAAYSVFGWGILRDDGRTDGHHFPTVVQKIGGGNDGDAVKFPATKDDPNGIGSPKISVAFRSGSKYYVAIGDLVGSHIIYDVTDAANPKNVTKRAEGKKHGIKKWDRHDGTGRVAFVAADGKLYIWSYADFGSASGTPMETHTARTGTFADLSFDEAGNLWVAETRTNLWKLEPVGNGYNPIVYTPFGGTFDPAVMHAAAGHVAVAGVDRGDNAYDVRLLKVEAGGPTLVNTDKFFMKYYHTAPQNYAEACVYCGIQADVQLVKQNGRTYLMYSAFGLGDVFEIQGGDSIHVTRKNTFGTNNPHSKQTDAGPYVGDIVTFTANSSSANSSYDVTWNFGNPESTDNTAGPKKTGVDVSHQYTGLTTANAITTPKTVKAVTVQDSTIAAQVLVNLKVPTPRISVSGISTPFTANATGVEVVAGGTFQDASDGSVESHYGTWTIDGVATKYKPNANDISVGSVGPHTLSFVGSYGKYDATNLTGTGLYNTTPLTLSYVVKPFRAVLNPPTTVGSDVRFSATPLVTTDRTILSATNWTVTWTFNAAAAGDVSTTAAVSGVPQTVPVGTIPTFEVPKASVTSGSTITLTIAVDAAGLSTAAQPYASITTSSVLTTPDPLIEVTGCANANSPCKLTAKSVGNASMTDWTYAWTLKRGTAVIGTSTSAVYEPSITQSGDYSVTLKTTKTVFEKEVVKNFTVAQSLCGELPASHQVAINKSCSSCPVGTTVTFSPSFLGYTKQACDTITWKFGDGGTATGSNVEHVYTTAGPYTVTMTITNTNGKHDETTTLTVTGGGGNPNPNTCTAPLTATFSWIGTQGCAPGSNCRTTESITFTPKRGVSDLQNCDQVSWNFGDNTTSSTKTPTKQYTTPGTYTVALTVTNTAGTNTVYGTVTVVAPPAGNCSQAPALGNFAITYSGGTSNCSNVNPNCSHGETITFNSQAFQYVPASCDTFEWDFGDGSPKGSGRTPTHVFTGGQTEYTVKLTVKNNAGQYTYTRAVKFAGTAPTKPVPTVTPTSFPATGRKGTAVTFTATSNLPNTTGWTWNFGDGTPSNTSQAGLVSQTSTITYTFTKAGTFTVKATARNSEDAATAPVGTAQAQIVVSEPPAIPEYRYLLPAAAYFNTPGAGAWRTDVQIYNPDPQVSETKPLKMEATFKGHSYPLEMIKATHVYENFLGNLLDFQRQDQGPIIITTKNAMNPPQIWTRTYFESSAGTYGQFIPAIRIDNIGTGGGAAVAEGAYFMSGLRHDNRYRTNVGFLNPNAATLNVTVKVYDEEGFIIGDFPLSLQPFQLDQFQLKSKVPALPVDKPFSIKIDVPPAQWLVAYASFIDGMSLDPVFLQAVRDTDVASADYKTSVIPGVGHTGAWRSDVTIFNPDRTGMQFDLRYYNAAGALKGEALNVKLGAGEFLQYGDILKQGVLGNVEDGLGTLKISVITDHSVYPMTFARTYFDDLANGTYGQGIAGFAPARANVKPNKPAFIAGVRNTETYYTNIGLVNVSATAVTATVTLLDPVTGAPAASIPYTLAPNQSLVGAFNGFGSIATGTLKIEANGNVWAFCSIIDRRTKDPEYVPATPAQ